MSSRSVQVATTVSFHRPLLMMLSSPVLIATTVFFHRPPTDHAVSWEPQSLHVLRVREDHYYSVLPQNPYWWCHQLRATKFACPPGQRWRPLLCSSTDPLSVVSDVEGFEQNCSRQGSRQLCQDWGQHDCTAWVATESVTSFTVQQCMMMMTTTDDPTKVCFTSRFCLMKSQTMLGYCNYHRVSVPFGSMSKIFKVDNCLALRSEPPCSLPNGFVHQCSQFYTGAWTENSHMALMGFEPIIFWHALQTSSL